MVTDAGMVRCDVCAGVVPSNTVMQLGGRTVCMKCKPHVAREMAGAQAAGPMLRYAGFWIRFAAILIDGILIGGVSFAFMFAIMMPMMMSRGGEPNPGIQIVLQLIMYGIQALYFILMHGLYGATLGKMAVGIKVVRPDGSPIGIPLAIGRYFATWLSGCILYIGYIMAGFDEEKRALHDRICETRVVFK